jgi:hypothetical protein
MVAGGCEAGVGDRTTFRPPCAFGRHRRDLVLVDVVVDGDGDGDVVGEQLV